MVLGGDFIVDIHVLFLSENGIVGLELVSVEQALVAVGEGC